MTDAEIIAETKKSEVVEQKEASTGAQGGGSVARAPAIIVSIIIATIVGLSLWFLVQPQPVLVQGEADATRIDIAARVDGKVGKRPVERGNNVAAGALLFEIDNPWTDKTARLRAEFGASSRKPTLYAARDTCLQQPQRRLEAYRRASCARQKQL